jgi:anti-sigma regulatory factor (Ser/Thr protein kinase)
MRLAQDDSAPAQARNYARGWLCAHHLPGWLLPDVELVVTELVTNAVRHARPPYDLEMSHHNGFVRGEVRDRSTTAPETNRNPDYRGGYGMNIVAARTTRWGCALQSEGKRIWFEIEVRTSETSAMEA